MPLTYSMLRTPWRIRRKLYAIVAALSDSTDPFDDAPMLVVLEMLLDAELDRLREAGRVSEAMEGYIQQDAPPG